MRWQSWVLASVIFVYGTYAGCRDYWNFLLLRLHYVHTATSGTEGAKIFASAVLLILLAFVAMHFARMLLEDLRAYKQEVVPSKRKAKKAAKAASKANGVEAANS